MEICPGPLPAQVNLDQAGVRLQEQLKRCSPGPFPSAGMWLGAAKWQHFRGVMLSPRCPCQSQELFCTQKHLWFPRDSSWDLGGQEVSLGKLSGSEQRDNACSKSRQKTPRNVSKGRQKPLASFEAFLGKEDLMPICFYNQNDLKDGLDSQQ